MTFARGLFAHWPFDPERLRPLVPRPLELDVRDGRAWVGVVPFVLARAGVRGSPTFVRLTAPELNLRTYVRLDGTPGLYFLDIDLGSPFVSRLVGGLTRLPVHAADVRVRVDGDRVEFRSVRGGSGNVRFAASYRPDGDPSPAERGTLDHWLVERRRLYAPDGEDLLYGEIAHDPWPLRPADAPVRENTLFEAAGLPVPEADPRVRYVHRMEMTGSVLRRVRR